MKKFPMLLLAIIVLVLTVKLHAEETISMGLKEVVAIVLENNLNLKIERMAPKIRQNSLIAEQSVFDPSLTLGGSVLKQEPDNTASGTQLNQTTVEAELSKKFSSGTRVAINMTQTEDDIEATYGAAGGSATSAALVITQPLLKDRGRMVNLRNITLSGYDLETAKLSFKQTVIDSVTEAKSLYWQYYFSLALLEVQEQSLALARRLLAEMEEKVRLGSAPRLDLLQSKAEVASREGDVISAERDVYNNQDSLFNYIYGGLTITGRMICRDTPSFKSDIRTEDTIQKTALAHRTDYLKTEYNLKSSLIDLKYFKNQKMPALDITGTLGLNEGEADGIPSSTGYEDYYYGMVALSIDLPFGFRKDKANYASALLLNKQQEVALENVKTQVILSVRKALRGTRAAHKSYQAAIVASKLAGQSMEVEEGKFKNGLSTSYNVHLYQRDLTNAKANEVAAAVNYQLAVIELNKAAGITLEKNNIEIKEALK